MKRRNRFSVVFLCVSLLLTMLVLSGCSSNNKEQAGATANVTVTAITTGTETSTVNPTTTATPTSTPTPTPTATSTITPTATPTVQPETETSPRPAPTEDVEPNEGMFDPWFEAYTSVAYSSGTDSEWAYGNQRKEFTASKPCYVRISNSVVAPWHWGYVYGLGNKITITYRFTGTANCRVDVSDGFLTQVPTNDPNVTEYTRVIEAKSAKDDTNIVVFQYIPEGPGSVSLEIVYDNQVKSKYDVRNTIYFIEEETW